ncbi:MAG: extracellular solute-binding protein [Actinomycetaceae bacterium]|nr:extracellular solute-binding protein [Actinomycetaceae bacterium]
MKKKMFSAAAVVASGALVLAGCGGGSSAPEAGETSGEQTGTVRMWVMEGSFSDESRQFLIDEFAKENPGSELKIEVQQWDGIVSKLQTSLASNNESPDLVEIGNTQTTTFTTVGAFADVSDIYPDLGGEDLIQSFVDASTVDGKIFALPIYAGARGVFYRTDLFEQAGIKVPEIIDDFTKAVIELQSKNPEGTDNFSGMYMAAVDVHGIHSYLFAKGFDYAQLEGDKWVGKVNTPESIKALEGLKEIFDGGTKYALDSQAAQKAFEKYFNEGETAVLIGTGNVGKKIDQKYWDENKVGVFAIPSDTPGEPGKTFAGGSNIALAAKAPNPELAKKALKTVFGEGFQKKMAEVDGWVPGNTTYGEGASGPFGDIASKIVSNSKLTPNSPEWGVNFGGGELSEFYGKIAKGEDIKKLADELNALIEEKLNAGK